MLKQHIVLEGNGPETSEDWAPIKMIWIGSEAINDIVVCTHVSKLDFKNFWATLTIPYVDHGYLGICNSKHALREPETL